MTTDTTLQLDIDHLGLSAEHIATIATWHQAEWQHISPTQTTESRIQLYSSYKCRDEIPCTLLAQINHQAVGSASLVLNDLELRPELTPWLASVYVHTDFRQRGIATQLINACLEMAARLKIPRLYLFTPEQKNFYAKRGWQFMESCIYHDEHIDIMFYDLPESGH